MLIDAPVLAPDEQARALTRYALVQQLLLFRAIKGVGKDNIGLDARREDFDDSERKVSHGDDGAGGDGWDPTLQLAGKSDRDGPNPSSGSVRRSYVVMQEATTDLGIRMHDLALHKDWDRDIELEGS